MAYSVKELFYTLQGEGAQAGRAAVFCRFAGCNLWSGREEDRAIAACSFCDTDFVGVDGEGGGRFKAAAALASAIASAWRGASGRPYVVFTGGEPLLQLDAALIAAVHAKGFDCAVETNGALEPPAGIDWVCVSPKAGAPLRIRSGDELKLVFPQAGLPPSDLVGLDFKHFWLQAHGGPLARGEYRRSGRLLSFRAALATKPADAQVHWNSVMFELSKQFRFEAAHTLPERKIEADGSRRIHGHSYRAEVFLRGERAGDTGMLVDLGLLERELDRVREALDHHFLDEVAELGAPTMENLCAFIWRGVSDRLPGLVRVAVYRDSSGDACVYFGPQANP